MLRAANLTNADLGRAYLRDADLSGALLCRTILLASAHDGSDLHVNLLGARYGKSTQVPVGFDAAAHGAIEDPCCAEKDLAKACAGRRVRGPHAAGAGAGLRTRGELALARAADGRSSRWRARKSVTARPFRGDPPHV